MWIACKIKVSAVSKVSSVSPPAPPDPLTFCLRADALFLGIEKNNYKLRKIL